MQIHAIMVTFRRHEIARATLSAVGEQSRVPDTMTVVDNAPEAGGEGAFRSVWGDDLRYVPAGSNLGPAGGISLGMRQVLGFAGPDDWILLIDDDDPPPTPFAVERLGDLAHRLHEVDPAVAGVGLRGARFDLRRGRVRRLSDADLSHGPAPVDHIAGNQFPMYRATVVEQVGTFDSSLFFGFEELEFGLRLVSSGWHLYCDGDWRLAERRRRSRLDLPRQRPSRRVVEVQWRQYYSRRNLILILRRHRAWSGVIAVASIGLLEPLANLPRSPTLSVRSLRLQGRAIWDGLTGRTGRRIEPAVAE